MAHTKIEKFGCFRVLFVSRIAGALVHHQIQYLLAADFRNCSQMPRCVVPLLHHIWMSHEKKCRTNKQLLFRTYASFVAHAALLLYSYSQPPSPPSLLRRSQHLCSVIKTPLQPRSKSFLAFGFHVNEPARQRSWPLSSFPFWPRPRVPTNHEHGRCFIASSERTHSCCATQTHPGVGRMVRQVPPRPRHVRFRNRSS